MPRLVILIALATFALPLAADTTITYQGQLEHDGAMADGTVEMTFTLHDSKEDGSQVAGPLTENVEVTDGLFQVDLDFGDAFAGERWLEIEIDNEALAPRQRVTPAPVAVRALNVAESANAWQLGGNTGTDPETDYIGTNDETAFEIHADNRRAVRMEPWTDFNWGDGVNIIAGSADNAVGSLTIGATIAGGGSRSGFFGSTPNQVQGSFGTVSGGRDNTASANAATVSGGANNTASGSHSTVGGGSQNIAVSSRATVAGGDENVAGDQADPEETTHATVGGGNSNSATGQYSTVGGGDSNTATASYTTVGGGNSNTASVFDATVGGGDRNNADGSAATVGGGRTNTARDTGATVGGGTSNFADGEEATVGGGQFNVAENFNATVGGGRSNTASGHSSTVPGGRNNEASGDYSFAAGHNTEASGNHSFAFGNNANANRTGMVMFTDSNTGQPSTGGGTDRFIANFNGGYRLETDADDSVGVYMQNGDSSWTSLSARKHKTNLESVDTTAILDAVANLEISRWSYEWQTDIDRVGPMAGEFYKAFGVGRDDEGIQAMDAIGVLYAAVQGLAERNAELESQINRVNQLEAENAELKERLARLESVILDDRQVAGGQQ